MALKVGDKAPEFKLKDSFEKEVSLSNFKENWDLLQKNNIVVLGISKDNASSHQKFIEKFNLPFILLTDPEPFKVSSDYDSYGLKKFMGKEYMGMMRNTFLIDPEGNIEKIYLKVKAAIMADHIIADLGLS
jgi:peroxiredoxin Q/BCP